MKKLIIFLLAITLVLGLCACKTECEHADANTDGKCDECGESVGECTHEDTNNDQKCDKCQAELSSGTQTGDLVLVAGSKTEFAVVSADSLSGKASGYVQEFIKNLNRYYLADQALQQNYDAPGFDDAVEIIFGSPANRGDAFKKDEHYLGYKGFSIEVVGNKLFVLAGGDKGYQDAIEYLEDTLFNLESYGENVIDELVIPADTKYEVIPSDYNITEITIDGTSAAEFVLAYNNSSKDAKAAALILQETIYKQAGIWVPYVALSKVTDEQKVIYVENTKGDTERTTDNGCTIYVEDGDLHIECEFENKFEEIVYNFIDSKITKGKVKITSSYTYTKDVRNIYYKDFGAVGDGVTDDFFALKECHDYANLYGHTVNADSNATYYIGKENGSQSITIKTDTYWNCCSFIWDDRYVDLPSVSKAYQASIFKITPDKSSYTLSGSKLPVTSLAPGSTSFGDWVPGERVLVTITDNTKRHYIRYGSNQNNGSAQSEIVIVNADGTFDADTPVQWDYTTLSKMVVYPIEDTPITISGGTKDQVDNYSTLGTFSDFDGIDRATIYTYFNEAPSEYTYYARNIDITRSNVTIKNLEHVLYDQDAETSAPYTGFIKTTYCSDVIVEGMIFQKQKGFSTVGAGGGDVGMGSYEISANNANRITWRHCRQSNFFNDDGSISRRGYMGTNYCKNLMFDDMVSCSFDAHCNLYNGTIKDTTAEHLNFIGGGTIRYENVTVYVSSDRSAFTLRSDYGSIWNGDVIIDGLTMRTASSSVTLSVANVTYTNHWFGYTCYLPKTISINNAKIVYYGYEVKNGVRTEWDIATNHVPLHLYAALEKYTEADISDPNADMTAYPNDYKKCDCETVYNGEKTFNDTDGDGRCNNDLDPDDGYSIWCWGWEDKPNTSINVNPYVPTEEIYLTNCGNLVFVLPDTPQFEDTKLYIDGVLQE